ncbi:LEPR-XLL domain-containing protein [Vibrio maerlii]|uniref:LEPR-XLL domain-containing protein n=1 Tax=Vibrio maerlii TaxID=2231648 RepID=UPI000E3CFFB8|nr:LEPR-XLL domain-containing protein [Vibrio maerlii]
MDTQLDTTTSSKKRSKGEQNLHPQLSTLMAGINRAIQRDKWKLSPVKNHLFAIEQLEPRLLLSADPMAVLVDGQNDVTLQVVEKANEQYIQLINNNDNGAVLGERALTGIADGSIITVTGTDSDDTFTVDQSFLDLGERSFIVQFDGAQGTDTIAADSAVTESHWQISGDNSGSMGTNGIVEFLNAEALEVTNTDESQHVLSAINNSYNWQITDEGDGVLSTLESQLGTIVDSASSTQVTFTGFDEIHGSSTDYLDYSQYTEGVTVDLENSSATGFDSVSGFNTIIGSSFNDVLAGDTNNNLFVVGFGDSVDGAGGGDSVVFRDTGSTGVDITVSVDKAGEDFTYQGGNWDGTTFTNTADQTITLVDVDLLSAEGGTGDNYFDFSTIDVSAYLVGGDGDDVLIGGSEDDVFVGGAGDDTITGNGGDNEVIAARSADMYLSGATLGVDLDGDGSSDETDTYANIKAVYLKAVQKDTDTEGYTLDANASDDYDITLEGTDLDDTLVASDYGDVLIGLKGTDSITAGDGVDRLQEEFSGRAHIAVSGLNYKLDLSHGANELVTVTLPNSKTGTGYTLTFNYLDGNSYTTEEIDWDASTRDFSRAIEKALNLNYGQIIVLDTTDGFTIEFAGLYAGQAILTNVTTSLNDVTALLSQEGETVVDTLIDFGTEDYIEIEGGFGADDVDLSAFDGNAEISTQAGIDTIRGAKGVNTIDAGDGNDFIYVSGNSNDFIIGGEGEDTLLSDMSSDLSGGLTFDLDNHQLEIGGSILIGLDGIETAELIGSAGNDIFDASDFYGVSESTSLALVEGWEELTEHILRFTLDDDSAVIDIDVQGATTLEELIALINAADDRETGAMQAQFDQVDAKLSISGISSFGVAGSDDSILAVLGLDAASVSNTVATGVTMSLVASVQLTTQRGNGGSDTFTGSQGADQFYVDSDDISVIGGTGYDVISTESTSVHDEVSLSDSAITWKDTADSNAEADKSLTLSGVDKAEVLATSGATKLDATDATIDVVLDAGQTNADLVGGSGYNEFRLDVSLRSDTATDSVDVTVNDSATSNDIVFYGGSSTFDVTDFDYSSVTGSNYSLVTESSGDLTIGSAITIEGQSLKFRAGDNKIIVNADMVTDGLNGDSAGNIEFYARHVEVSDGVTISAQGDTLASGGDIRLFASDARNVIKGLGFYNYDNVGASITIGNATIQGRDIEIIAMAETNPDSPVNYGGEPIDSNVPSIDDFKNELENTSLFFGYSRSEVSTSITIAEGAIIKGDDIVIEARSIARVTSQPLAFMLSVAIGSIKSSAVVEMNGTILAEGDVTVASNTENYLYVNADQFFGYKGFSASVAVGLLDSDSLVTVSDTATIVAGGDLDVTANTADFTYVGALSDAGAKGKLAASVAVHIEHGDTQAILAGDVFVLGDVTVNAEHKQGRVSGAWGTLSEAIVDRVPSILDNFTDKYKQKASNVITSTGLKWLGKKASPSDRLKPTKFTLGLAFAYAEDTNNVNSYIGIDGKSSDIQVGGSLTQTASSDARLLTSVNSVSSSISNTKQLEGSTGTKSEFSQVPFGGAVSVSIGNLKNNANALMVGDTSLDVLDKITLDAHTENLTGLISTDTTFKYVKPTKIGTGDIDTDYQIKNGDLIEFGTGDYEWDPVINGKEPDIGLFGAVYKFVGSDDTIQFATEDYTNTSRWELLGDSITSIPNQLFGGESNLYLIDNSIKTEAAGAKVSIGLNFAYLNSNQNADAKVGGGVEINQRTALENMPFATVDSKTLVDSLLPNAQIGVRALDVSSSTVNKSVDYVGLLTDTTSNIPVLKQIYAASGASQSLNGSGASVYINNVTMNSDSVIENGAKVYADELSVDADNTLFAINLGYSAGYGIGTLGISGLFMGNYIESNVNARVDSGVELDVATRINNLGGVEKLSVTANNQVDILTVAGGGASGGAIGVGASAIMNDVTKVTKAQIGNSDALSRSGDVDVNGDAKVSASSDGFVFGTAMSAAWATGKVAPSGGEEPETANSEYGISVSGAFIFNKADHTTEASVNNLNSFNADALTLEATENSLVLAFPISYASSEANSFALAAAGIGLRNDVEFDIDAGMKAINTLTLDSLSINAVNNSTVVTASISAALSGIAETSGSQNSSSIAITGNVSINNVTNDVDAFLSDITTATINSKNSDGFAADIKAKDESDIYAIALGVAYAGNGTVGVTYAENNIVSDIDALVNNSDITAATGKIRQRAISEADILSVAIGAGVSKDTAANFNTQVGVSVAAAVSYNKVRMNTRSKVVDSTITLPSEDLDSARLDVKANNEADIIAVVVAPSVGLQSGSSTTVTLSGSGAYVQNEVYGDTIAQIDDSTIVQETTANAASDAENGVFVSAVADGDISSSVVSASFAYAGATTGTGVSGGIGIAIAENKIGDSNGEANKISALITDTDIDVSGTVDTFAESKQEITSVVVGASVALAKSTSGSAGALSGVGADTNNSVMIDTTSEISATQADKTIKADSVAVKAKDTGTITSAVVGASIAGGYSPASGSGALSIGVALAENDINNDTNATINNVALGASDDRVGSVDVVATTNSTITATSVAASFAVSYSTSGSISVSGAGANAINTIKGETNATLSNSEVYSSDDILVTATNTSKINAEVAAVSVSGAGGNGGGLGISIGAAVTENYIGDSGSRLGVSASIIESEFDATGDVTVSATADLDVDSGVGAGSMAIAGGSGGGIAGSGSGVSATNSIYANVDAYVDNTSNSDQIKAADLTVTASNTSDIDSDAGAASIAAGFGSGGGIAGTIGVALARNEVDNNTRAYVSGADVELTGALDIDASADNTIESTSVAASVAVAFGSGGGFAVSGAGANSINSISGDTMAYISDADVKDANSVAVTAENISDITAQVAAVSVAGGGGSGGGVGVSIGAAVSENEIGTENDRLTVASYIEDSSVTTTGGLSLTATGNMTIYAGVGAGGMAIAGGAGGGISGAGSGVVATNDVYAAIDAYIDNTGASSAVIDAALIDINSSSTSSIEANLGSASLAIAGGSGGGISVNIGLSIAENLVDVNTSAYIKEAKSVDSTGAITLDAIADNDIDTVSVAATSSIAGGAGGGISIGGAGAEAVNNIYGETQSYIQGSQIDSASSVSVNAKDTSDIDAEVVAASLSGAGGAGGGVGIALGAALASNNIGSSNSRQGVRSFVKNSGITTSGDLSIDATGKMTIDAGVGAGSMALSGGAGGGLSGAGAGASTTNSVYTDVETYIDNSSASSKVIDSASLTLDADNTNKITATTASASLAAGFGAGGGVAGTVSVALAENTVDANTASYIADVNEISTGDVSVTADTDNTIKATSVAASVSAAGGAGGGLALSGAGAETVNYIYGDTTAYIEDTTIGASDNKVGAVEVLAVNTSSIEATIASVAAAGAGGAAGGVGVSLGGSVAVNEIGDDTNKVAVSSYIDNSAIYASGTLEVDSSLDMTIDAGVGAGSAAATGGAAGVAVAGAAVRVENYVYAEVDSYIEDSSYIGATDISVTSSSTSDIDATAATATLTVNLAPAGVAISLSATRVINDVEVSLNSDIRNSTLDASGDFTVTASSTDDVYTMGVATSVSAGLGFAGAGVFVETTVTGDIGVSMTDSDITADGEGSVKALANAKQKSEGYGISAGFIAAGVVFADSETDVDTILLMSATDYRGGDLTMVAKATEDNYVLAVAGSGGLAAGAGVGADTKSTSTTKVEVDDESSITLGESSGAGVLDVKAEHLTKFDAKVVVASGGLLSGSGAEIDHDITADVNVILGDGSSDSDNLEITALDINTDAINRAYKNEGGKIQAVAVGLASAAGADSRTVLDMATTIDVGDDADLTAWGTGDDDGISLNALNDLDITDKVILNASGALAGTGATVKITDDELLAQVRIGKNAILESVGDLQLSARGQGTVVGNVEADSSGAISVSVTNANVNITPENIVLIDEGADITAYGDVNLSTGTDTDFNRDDYKIHALIDSFSDSVIPIDDAGAYATLTQTNTITVASGAHVKTARQMNLHAERFGFADMDAQTKTVNWASALGGTANLGGDVTSGATGSVYNYGTLETGIRRDQSIEFISLNNDGTVNEVVKTDGVTYSTSIEALSSSLFEDLDYAQEQLSIFNDGKSSDTDIEAFYKSEIDRIQQLLLEKGLMDVSAGGEYFPVELSTSVITIDDIHAEAGRVDIRASADEGYAGYIIAPGDASVTIINHTLASLVVNDITIPQENGGVYLNGERQDAGVDNQPLISIVNDVDLDKELAELQSQYPDNNAILTWPSITVNGDVTNRSGTLELKSLSGEGSNTLGKGDINIYADIDVENQVVMTGGSTVISLPPGSTYSVDGSEYAKWNSEIGNNGLNEATDSQVDDLIGRTITGPSIYADNISITAEYININGKIQSGKESFVLDIDESMEDTIQDLKDSGATGLIRLDVGSEDFSVFYDATNDQIVVGDMRVSGGYIELNGHILNTNENSEIELLGGYAEIEVNNNTDLDIKILGLDASQRGKGTLILRDKAQANSSGEALVTTYIKDETGVSVTTEYAEGSSKSTSSGSDSMEYLPKEGWRYSWSMGQERFDRRYTTEATSSWLGIDAFAKDPNDVVFDGDPEPLGDPTLRGEGAYFEFVPLDKNKDYTFDTNDITLSSETSLVKKWTKSTWWGKKTYYAKFVNESKVRTESIHSIKADYGVNITFTGLEAGAIDITSTNGGDVIVQGAISNSEGTTTINTNAKVYTQSNGSVGGKDIVITASKIGGVAITNVDGSIDAATNALRTNLTNDADGGITARTFGGRINIVEIDGPLVVNNISSASIYDSLRDTGGKVYLSAVGGIEGESGTSGVVRGGIIHLNSEAHVGSSSQALTIDSGVFNTDSVTVLAVNDIYLTELDGDFLAKEISSESGDVTITVSKGSLQDANTSAIRDERTYEELSTGLWVNLGLIEGSDSAQDKIDDVVEAYITARELEYSTYWNIRNGQFEGDYDVSDVATISEGEETYYREVYQAQGEEQGLSGTELETFVDDAITTLNNKRNAEYHSLHATYGQEAYDIEYEYTLSDDKRAELEGSVHVWTEDELLNLISGSLLKPITNTQASIEDANISAGGDITIVTQNDIGSATGAVEIDLDGDYTDDERVQLAAAERNDVYFLLEERAQNVTVDVEESDSGDSLVRDSGSWIDDGFVAGMQIRIAGDSSNANDEGSFYEVATVTDSTMTLTSTDLSVEINVTLDVAAISSTPDLITLINDNDANWADVGLVQDGYVQVGSETYQIVRMSGLVIDLEEVDPSVVSSAVTTLSNSDYRTANVTKIVIDQREDIDVLVAGTISATASGNVYLGSEQSMEIDSISGENVRIKSKQSLTDGTGSSASVYAGSTLILEAGSGAIGSSSNRFNIDLDSDATLTARAQQDIYITEVDSNLNVATIYSSGGTVDLLALNGSIVDAFNHDYENIRAVNIVLTSNIGSIGEIGNLLDINLIGGTFTATALNDIRVNETEQNLDIDKVESTNGDVELIAHLAILDALNDVEADVIANSIALTARLDTVGQIGNDLDIDTGSAEGDNLTLSSANNAHITETTGDLYLNTIQTGAAAIAFIAAPAGRILNDNSSGNNVTSGMAYLFAAKDIGESDNAITTEVGNIQGQSTAGSTYIENTGALSVGGVVNGLPNGLLAGGDVNIVTRSPITITENITAVGDINLISTDNSADDNITVVNGVTLETQSNININSGDGFILEAGAVLDADMSVNIDVDKGDTGNSDAQGAVSEVHGSINAGTTINFLGGDDEDSLTITGSLQAQTITINMAESDDYVMVDAASLVGDVYVNMGSGDDEIIVNQLHSRDDALVLDGQGGTDSYIINRTGSDADYTIDVSDSGAKNDGADVLEINGLAQADTFLLRAHFVAAMHDDGNGGYGDTVERINYDSSINARLIINGLDGADSFYSDDTSTIVTLDGGAGNDSFQVGQLYGSERTLSAGTVAAGDEIETTETTLGYLSRGNSLPMVIYGGDGEDSIKVYSNKAVTKLYGEAGDDSFVVRAFLLADSGLINNSVDVELFGGEGEDTIEYSINAALKIDGGAGNDRVVVLGTEGDDNFMITEDGIFGAGLNIGYTGVEFAEVDGLEGDDTFYVLSTNEDVETTIIGGLGADQFNVASDVTKPIVSYAVEGRSSFINHSVFSEDEAFNGIFVEGISLNVASQDNGAVGVDKQTLVVDESGVTDSYELSLNVDQPTVATVAYVTVSAARASSSDKDSTNGEAASILVSLDGINYYESLVVTYDSTSNWDDNTTIYVKATDDSAMEGARDYVISHSVTSDNPEFDNLDIANVEVQVYDNDQADLIVLPQQGEQVVEGGSSITYDVRLTTQPEAGEVVTVSIAEIIGQGAAAQLSLANAELTFDSSDWNQVKSFTVTALDDLDVENVYQAGVSISTSSSLNSSDYNQLDSVEQMVAVVDNDSGAVIIEQTDGSTLVSETQTDEYTIVLSKAPTAPVTVNLLNDGQTLFSSADSRFNALDNTVTFDATNWDQPITISLAVNPDYQEQEGQPVQNPPLQPHTLTGINGKLVIEGGSSSGKDRALSVAVMLPTETDSELPVKDIEINESQQTDELNIFNDGSVESDNGILTGSSLTGLGMGEGIEYSDIEVVELFLGQGDDSLTVEGTAAGSITVVHGGGGNDTLSVTGSDAASALILFGETGQNGWSYDATSDEKTDKAREFANPGNDIIDASGAGGSVVIYGGAGNDQITGSQYGDHLAGGSGNDTINGLGGTDHIYGDAGFNVDTSTRLDLTTQMLTVVNDANTQTDNLETSDDLTVGNDIINAGEGDDIVIADKGVINQAANTNRILSSTLNDVLSVSNTGFTLGGSDTVVGNEGNDMILGGQGQDYLYGGNGAQGSTIIGDDADTILGDMGTITLDSGIVVLVASSDTSLGDADEIYAQEDNDIVIAGAGSDLVKGSTGNDSILGDFGEVDLRNGTAVLKTEEGDQNAFGDDTIHAGSGNDRVLGGLGSDVIKSASGNTHVVADNGSLNYNAQEILVSAQTSDVSLGGNDTLTLGSGDNTVLAGNGEDTITTENGVDHIISDNGLLTYDDQGVLVQAMSQSHSEGGDDTIVTGNGNKLIISGYGNDSVTTASGDDTIVGDNGQVDLVAGVVRSIRSTDMDDSTAGNDTIVVGTGNDRVIAGLGSNIDAQPAEWVDGVLEKEATDAIVAGDSIESASGNTHVLADNGVLSYNAQGVLIEAVTTEESLGGDDDVTLGNGNNVVLGGQGNDTITTSEGIDHIFGDNGQFTYDDAGVMTQALSTSLINGGNDVIDAGNGGNIVVAGNGNDQVTTGAGNDIVIGDNGQIDLVDGVIRVMQSTDEDETTTGSDIITLGTGNDKVIAGLGSDIVTSTSGDTHVLADNGVLSYNAQGILIEAVTTEDNLGGSDVVVLGFGDNKVIAGEGSDNITTVGGDDHIIGDNGQLLYDDQGVITNAKTKSLALGGADAISAGDGENIVLAGFGSDSISTGAGQDTVVGDNGEVRFVDGARRQVFSTDTTNATGGSDVISVGAGQDQVIAGVGSDNVTNQSGETIVIGDDGVIFSDAAGRYVGVRTGDTTIGGNDTLTGGSDRDILFGGFGSDRLDGGAGNDILGGDGSQVTRSVLSVNEDTIIFESVDLFVGGDDTLLGGAGQDQMQGHFGSDLFFANFSEDVLVGEYGRFTFVDSESESTPASIISLAQGNLDLIRRTQSGLFGGYAKQVYAESNLGQAARSRTAVTTVFDLSADQAFANLSPIFQANGSGGSEGADFVIPTDPTAAGFETLPEDGEEVSEEVINEEGAETKAAEPTVVPLEVQGEQSEGEPTQEPQEECDPETTECKVEEEVEEQEAPADTSSSNIDVKAAVAGLGGWMVMRADSKATPKGRKQS